MSTRKKIAKYSTLLGGYGFGIFLNQGINLLLIPIFWSVLTPEDFGIIALTQIITLFLQPIYMFGVSETIQRFYYKWHEPARPHYLSWIFWYLFSFTFALTLLLDFLGSHFSNLVIVNVAFDPLLRLTLWSTFFSNFINIPIAVSRIQQKVKVYNILVNGSFITQIGIVFYLVKIEKLGPYGYIKGFFIANLIWFIPIIIYIFKSCILFPSRKFIDIPIKYAAPICLGGIVEGLGSTMDRYFLDKFLPLSTTGFYNLARQFGSLVNIVNAVTKLVFVPYIYKINALKNSAASILGHLGLIYSVIMTAPLIAVCTLSHEIIKILDPSGVYLQIVPYVPYFALSFYFAALATVIGRGMDLSGKTKFSFLIPLMGSLVSLGVYLYSLPKFGIWGVLWSVLLGSLTKNLVNIVLANYYFPRRLYLKEMGLGLFLALICYLLLGLIKIENPYLSIIVKITIQTILIAAQIKIVLLSNFKAVMSPVKIE